MGTFPALKVGIALTGGLARDHLDLFCEALAQAVGYPIQGLGVWYYHRLVEAMELGQVDVAWLPPILAAEISTRGLAIPMALPIRGGVTSFSTALFTRRDGPYRTLQDLDHVRAAWVDRRSAAGYLLIRAHLRAQGVDLEHAFAADCFTGSHDEVAAAVLDGSADVGASFVHLDAADQRVVSAPWGSTPMRILARAGPIPADVFAASPRLAPEHFDALQCALLALQGPRLREAARVLFAAEGFVAPPPGHLDAVAGLLPLLEGGRTRETPLR